MKLQGAGGNYRSFYNFIKHNNIDTSHFTGQAHNKGKSANNGFRGPKIHSVKELLINGKWTQSHRLKNRLIKEGMLKPICHNCRLTHWMDNTIPLELDHISGDNLDNRLENIRLLCPNCHALTPTYRGKNKRKNSI